MNQPAQGAWNQQQPVAHPWAPYQQHNLPTNPQRFSQPQGGGLQVNQQPRRVSAPPRPQTQAQGVVNNYQPASPAQPQQRPVSSGQPQPANPSPQVAQGFQRHQNFSALPQQFQQPQGQNFNRPPSTPPQNQRVQMQPMNPQSQPTQPTQPTQPSSNPTQPQSDPKRPLFNRGGYSPSSYQDSYSFSNYSAASQYFKNIEKLGGPGKMVKIPKGAEVSQLEEPERPKLQRVDTFRVNTVDERRKMEEEGKQIFKTNKGEIQRKQAARIASQKPVDREKELSDMFKAYDTNSDGVISIQELIVVARVWGIEINSEQSEILIRSFLKDRKVADSFDAEVSLSFTEFKEVMDYFLQLKIAFDTHDRDSNRLINKLELRTLLNAFNWNFVETTRNKLMSFFDRDHSGSIDFDEYFTMMLHLREVHNHYQSRKIAKYEITEIHALLRPMGVIASIQELEVYVAGKKLKFPKRMDFDQLIDFLTSFSEVLPEIQKKAKEIREAKLLKKMETRSALMTNKNLTKTLPTKPSRMFLQRKETIAAIQAVVGDNPTARAIIADLKSKNKQHWEDPEFPADGKALFPHEPAKAAKCVSWKRPSELHPQATLFIGGAESGDVMQGALGDCWFVSALSTLAQFGTEQVENLFVGKYPEYGFYQVRIFKDDKWHLVTVDDRLPITSSGKLLFASCRDRSEFWVPIVEKAYAKLHGSFSAIESGSVSDALVDLTGEASEAIDIEGHDAFWNMLLHHTKEGFLMGCSFSSKTAGIEEETKEGLLLNHAYGIMDCQQVGSHRLLRIRNPWGCHEWKGRWSDGSREWTPELKKHFNFEFADDGTFFMCFEDFSTYFNRIFILRLLTDDIGEKWEKYEFNNSWTAETAGGCINNLTFIKNPQWQVQATKPGLLFISLHQRDKRMLRDPKKAAENYPAIGITILSKDKSTFFRTPKCDPSSIISMSNYASAREIAIEVAVEANSTYIIVPSTFNAGIQMDYFCTLYAQQPLAHAPRLLTQEEPAVSVKGEWKGKTAGGCLNNSTWVNNPQYVLEAKEQGPVSITLQQAGISGKPTHVGIYIWKTTTGYRNLSTADIAFQSPLIDTALITGTVEGPGKFIVMPTTFNAGQETTFELKACSSTASLSLVKEWEIASVKGEWKQGQSGGCCNHTTWKENPKFTLILSKETELTIILASSDGTKKPMGFCIFNPALTQQVFSSKFMNGASVSATTTVQAGTFTLLPTTFNPNIMASFDLSIYTTAPVTLVKQ